MYSSASWMFFFSFRRFLIPCYHLSRFSVSSSDRPLSFICFVTSSFKIRRGPLSPGVLLDTVSMPGTVIGDLPFGKHVLTTLVTFQAKHLRTLFWSLFLSQLILKHIPVPNNFLCIFLFDRLCGLVVRVPGYTTEMYCASCEVRTEFKYVM
jgi:hypothetical protein